MIRLQTVSKRYASGRDALRGVSLDIPSGTMAFLTGHSGAGKSTLLRLLLRLETPTRGRILVNDHDIARLGRRQLPAYRQGIGVVFQEHNLLPRRTVFDNVALPLLVAGYRPRDVARRVRAALGQVGLLDRERAVPDALSWGEQQRVGIARAVVNRPRLLLADEPTGNLDPGLSREIMTLFARFNEVGTTVLVASHDLDLIATLGRPVLELHEGCLVANPFVAEAGHG